MHRRHAIRVLTAGGAVTALALPALVIDAAAQPTSPASVAPDDPFSGWADPPPHEADPRMRVLSYAVLAANPSNVQPWLVAFTGPETFDLYVDTGRLLHATDPSYRQVHLGQGTFLENLALAAGALGLGAEIRPFPRGSYDATVVEHKPVATVRLTADPIARPDPLFDAILARRSTKAPFDGEAISEADLDGLRAKAALSSEGSALRLASEPARIRSLADLVVEGARIESAGDDRVQELVYSVRLDPDELRFHRDGLDFAFLGAQGVTRAQLAAPDSPGGFRQSNPVIHRAWADTASAFGWITTTANTRADQVAAGRAYQRVNLAATAQGLALHPHSQLLEDYGRTGGAQERFHAVLGTAPGHTVQMFFRLGRVSQAAPPSPRRHPRDLVREA